MVLRNKERRASDSMPSAIVPDALAADVQLALSGDALALRRILDAVGPEVARVVRVVVNTHTAELDDIVQDALLSFVRALATFRGECSVRRFARRIAARTAIASRHRARVRAERHEPWQGNDEPADSGSDPELASLASRRQRLLYELLASLPVAQAETLALRVVLGMSLAEVAEATGAPENTVRSRLRLAREALRERIERDPMLIELLGGMA